MDDNRHTGLHTKRMAFGACVVYFLELKISGPVIETMFKMRVTRLIQQMYAQFAHT